MKALTVVCRGLKFPSVAQRCKGGWRLFPSTAMSEAQPCCLPRSSPAGPWAGEDGEGREERALPGWGSGGLVGSVG